MTRISEGIVMEAGPIKHWWDENWDTPEHWEYDNWREELSAGLVKAGFLVYRPHHAFKGEWDERAQAVNDTALRISDVVLNLTPPGVPSLGTDGEVLYAANFGGIIMPAPPIKDIEKGVNDVIERLKSQNIRRDIVEQEVVAGSLAMEAARLSAITSFLDEEDNSVLRLHYSDEDGRADVIDARSVRIKAVVDSLKNGAQEVDIKKIIKIEKLGGFAAAASLA